ncbi:MAG: hypothetical protein DSY42_03490 [Aquifex sp.]|nr:MAG: hypothetical protein DSY42_03490 [Aquifex sp.]
MPIPRKPVRDVDEFIKTAKVEEREVSKEAQEPQARKVKKFLIELPYDLWMELKMRAVKEGKSLKDLILDILKENA